MFFLVENAELFCGEGMFPVNRQTKPRSEQDTQMNYYVILTTSEEEEETSCLVKKPPKTWKCSPGVRHWVDMQKKEEMSFDS